MVLLTTKLNAQDLNQNRPEVGVIAAIQGTVTLSFEGRERIVVAGDKLYLGDQAITGTSSKLQILLKDLTTLTVAPSSQLVIDEFIYDPGQVRDLTSTLIKGVVKMASPRLKTALPSARRLQLPNATVSIRGTEFLASVDQGDDIVVLFNGVVSVENPQFITEIAKPSFGVTISDEGVIGTPEFVDENTLAAILDVFETLPAGETKDAGETADEEDGNEESSEEEASEESSGEESSGGENSGEETSDAPAEDAPASGPESQSDTQANTETSAGTTPAASTPVAQTGGIASIAVSAPLSAAIDQIAFAPVVTSDTETPQITLSIEAIDAQITQELNEVLDTVNSAVGEADLEDDPSVIDSDGDGVVNADDAFPNDPSETTDTDGDGIGNNADTDDDGDGVTDSNDPNPLVNDTLDTDGDGVLNIVDTDDDGDGVTDSSDAFPLNSTETIDTDADGIGNNADSDDDGDGVADSADAFPLDAGESADSDGDGTGDNADTLDNARLYTATGSSQSGWTSSSWNDLAAQLGTGTAVFTAMGQTATHSSGSHCSGCSADVDTTLSIDFSDMEFEFSSDYTFNKPGYGAQDLSVSSGDIPLGQWKLSGGSLSSVFNYRDLESHYHQDIQTTFTSTTDPSEQVTAEMSANFYYDAQQSDINDISTTQLGVRGYTKILYDAPGSGVDQLNTPFYSMDPQ